MPERGEQPVNDFHANEWDRQGYVGNAGQDVAMNTASSKPAHSIAIRVRRV
jgi:hypothetical protein